MEKRLLARMGVTVLALFFCYILSAGPVLAYVALRSNYNSATLKAATKPYLPVILLVGLPASQWYYHKCHDLLKPYVRAGAA